MRRRGPALVLLSLAFILAVACGGSTGGAEEVNCPPDAGGGGVTPPAGAQEIHVVGTDFLFEPDSFSVKAGTPVAVTFENRGAVAHDWILRTGDGVDVPGTKVCAEPGKSVVASFTLESGTYEAWCSLPGHYESGMKGEVTAQ